MLVGTILVAVLLLEPMGLRGRWLVHRVEHDQRSRTQQERGRAEG